MLEWDSLETARTQARSCRDHRLQHWWDEPGSTSQAFKAALGLQGPAWDLYLLYPPGARWDGELPPAPVFWMHQLSDPGADPALHLALDPSRLGRELDGLLKE